MGEIFVVWLIDADPPSEIGGGKGFYPVSANTAPPDKAFMADRFDTIFRVMNGEAGGEAVVTVHTSPRYREHFYREPYLATWRRFIEAGATLALHPHEDRADGSSLYDDKCHLAAVIARCLSLAHHAGLKIETFRSGGFAYHPALPQMLRAAGIDIDLSAAPGLIDAKRCISWPAASPHWDLLEDADKDALCEIPLGWNFTGHDLSQNYLFNERTDLAGLCRIWDAIRAQTQNSATPHVLNFLTHGFGLTDNAWRQQATQFLRYIRDHGGRLIGAPDARTLFRVRPQTQKLNSSIT